MRKSNKLLLGFGVFILALTIIGLIAGRLVIDYISSTEPEILVSNDLYNSGQDGFSSEVEMNGSEKIEDIRLTGVWDIKVSQGSPGLKIWSDNNKDLLKEVSINNHILVLSTDESNDGDVIMYAELTLPDIENLKKMECIGAAAIEISECSGANMALNVTGSISVELVNSGWDLLKVEGMGPVYIRSDSSEIGDFDIKLAGVVDVDLIMRAGGTIRGDITGTGSIAYSGDNITEEINFLGPGKIKHRK